LADLPVNHTLGVLLLVPTTSLVRAACFDSLSRWERAGVRAQAQTATPTLLRASARDPFSNSSQHQRRSRIDWWLVSIAG